MITTSKIYLKGYGYLDTYDTVQIPINYSLAEIKDISKRNSSYSKTILLPGTKNNNELLGFLFDVNINFNDATFLINRKVEATIFQNDTPILVGWFKLLKINKISPSDISYEQNIEYECVVYSNQAGIFDVIKDNDIQDIDLSLFNHTLTFDNITATTSNTYVDGYKYIWHYTSDNKYNVSDFRPATYVKTIWDGIFQNAGFSYTSTFLNSAPFTKLLIPTNVKDLLVSEEEVEKRSCRVSFSPSYSVLGRNRFQRSPQLDCNAFGSFCVNLPSNLTHSASIVPLAFNTNPYVKVKWNDETTGINFDGAYDNWDLSDMWFDTPKTGQYEFEFNIAGVIQVSASTTGATWYPQATFPTPNIDTRTPYDRGRPALQFIVEFWVQPVGGVNTLYNSYSRNYEIPYTTTVNPTNWQNNNFVNQPGFTAGISQSNYTFIIPKFQMNLNVGDKVTMQLRIFAFSTILLNPNRVPFAGNQINTRTMTYNVTINDYNTSNSFLKVKAIKNNLTTGDDIVLNSLLPRNIKQSEFIKSIVQMFNLYLIPDADDEKNIIIKTRDEFYSDFSSDILDWTDKISYNNNYNLTLLSELQNKTLNFNYKQGSDDVQKRYIEQTGFNYGQFKLNFDNDFLNGEQKIEVMFESTPLVKTLLPLGNEGNTFIVPYLIYGKETAPKILYDGGAITVSGYTVVENTTNHTLNYYNYAGHFDNPTDPNFDLNWGINEIYFYNEVLNDLTDNNLYNVYWYDYVNLISQSKLLSADFNLNEYDITNLNFAKPIWIRDSYWILNRIIDYNASNKQLTRVELIKSTKSPRFKPRKRIVKGDYFSDSQTIKPWLTIKGNLNIDNANPGDTGNINYGAMTSMTGRDNIVYNEVKNSRISGDRNIIGSGAQNVTLDGDDNFVGGSTNKIYIMGKNNVVFGGNVNISLINCDNITVLPGVNNVTLNNVSNQKIDAIASKTYYTEYTYNQNGFVVNNSQIVDGGLDNVIPPPYFKTYPQNMVDNGEDLVYVIGVEGADYIDGTLDGVTINLENFIDL